MENQTLNQSAVFGSEYNRQIYLNDVVRGREALNLVNVGDCVKMKISAPDYITERNPLEIEGVYLGPSIDSDCVDENVLPQPRFAFRDGKNIKSVLFTYNQIERDGEVLVLRSWADSFLMDLRNYSIFDSEGININEMLRRHGK